MSSAQVDKNILSNLMSIAKVPALARHQFVKYGMKLRADARDFGRFVSLRCRLGCKYGATMNSAEITEWKFVAALVTFFDLVVFGQMPAAIRCNSWLGNNPFLLVP